MRQKIVNVILVFYILFLVALFTIVPPYLSDKYCKPTEKMSYHLTSLGYAYTATFILGKMERGIVMQLYTGDQGFVTTWARNHGRTSCRIAKGEDWTWATEAIIMDVSEQPHNPLMHEITYDQQGEADTPTNPEVQIMLNHEEEGHEE